MINVTAQVSVPDWMQSFMFLVRVLHIQVVVGFLGDPQLGDGAHPPIPKEGVLREVLGDWADLALRQLHKNTRFRVVRAAGA